MSGNNSSIPVKHIAQLANIPLQPNDEPKLQKAFEETLKVVDQLKQLDVSQTPATYQVTGLENVWRDDEVDTEQMFTQQQATANAKESYENFIVVPQVIEQE